MKSYKELDEITDEEMKTWAENKQEEEGKEEEKEDTEKVNVKIDRKLDSHRNDEILDKKMIDEYKLVQTYTIFDQTVKTLFAVLANLNHTLFKSNGVL